MKRVALTIAGSDPSGGAGIQADLKTFHQFDVYGEAALTLLTVQNSAGVQAVECLSPGLVAKQVLAVLDDIPPHAIKTGALGNAGIVLAIAGMAERFTVALVVDPVMVSKHGAPLVDQAACRAIVEQLIPRSFLLTPNLAEAAALAGMASVTTAEQMVEAGRRLRALGACSVLVKGGHLERDAMDILVADDGSVHEFPGTRIDTRHTHGTGCTYSAAITACLAHGMPLVDAVGTAKAFIEEAIRTNPGLGSGHGPVNHHAKIKGHDSPPVCS